MLIPKAPSTANICLRDILDLPLVCRMHRHFAAYGTRRVADLKALHRPPVGVMQDHEFVRTSAGSALPRPVSLPRLLPCVECQHCPGQRDSSLPYPR